MSVHDGHRSRLRSQLLAGGLESFSDVQVLELLLTYAIARADVNPLAHSLLERFGSLSGVLDASPEELRQVDGIGEGASALLSMIPQLLRRYSVDRVSEKQVIATTSQLGSYLQPFFIGETEECVYLLCLDAKSAVLDCRKVCTGSVNTVAVNIRKIVELAIQLRASSVVLAHNHVSGIAMPSREDEETTRILEQTLDRIGVALADHIIIAGEDYVSMADSRMLRRI